MPGKVIGLTFNNGFPGKYAETPDQIIKTFPNSGDNYVYFGDPVFGFSNTSSIYGAAKPGATGFIPLMSVFKGVAINQVKSALSYPDQSLGSYPAGYQMPVIERGAVSVFVSNSASAAPSVDGNVYIRIANGTTAKPVGGFEAAADATTYTATVTTQTSGSANIVISAVTNLALGMTVSGTGIPSGAYITAINSSTLTITISSAATSTASSGTLTFGGNTIQITNATWSTTADSNGVAALMLKTRANS